MKKSMVRYIAMALAISLSWGCKDDTGSYYEPPVIETLDDLVGHTVAVPLGSRQDIALSEYKGLELVRVNAPTEVVLAVESGLAELGIMQYGSARAARLEQKGLQIIKDGFFPGESCCAFSKGKASLRDSFNAFLKDFKQSGEMDKLLSGWDSNLDSMVVESIKNYPPVTGKNAIKIGTALGTSPYILQSNGVITGIEIDIFNRFSRATGTPVEYSDMEFSALVTSATVGKIDAIVSHMANTEERAKKVLFSDPILQATSVVVGKIASSAPVFEKLSLREKTRQSVHINLVKEDRWKMLTDGLVVTLLISILSILLSTLMGMVLCWLRMVSGPRVSKFIGVIIDLVRGIPALILLMIMFYVVFGSVDVSGVLIAVTSFGIYYGAYFSEVFRSGMKSVDQGQWEAGAVLGFNKFKTFRLIALPQALKVILPIFKGDIIALIKETSIVGYVAINDLTRGSNELRALTMDPFFSLIIVTIIYFILSKAANFGLDRLQARILNPYAKKTNK